MWIRGAGNGSPPPSPTLRGATPPDAAWATEWELRAVDPPPWMDDDLLRKGQDVFDDWALDLTTALFCASLPHAYASGRGAAVLASVSELADGRRVEKRISLTGQMLLDITTPGALAVGAVGYRTVRRVRLLHACVRALLLLGDAAGNPWPTRGPRAPHQPTGHAGHAIGVHHCGIRRNHAARLSHEQSRQAGLSAPLERCRPLSRHHRSGPPGRSHGGEAAHPQARGVAAGDLAVGQGAHADAPRRHVRADAPPAAHPARRARAQARGPRGGRPAGRAAQQVGARRGRRRRLRAVGLAGDDRAVDPAAALAAARPGPHRALDRGGHGRRPSRPPVARPVARAGEG